MLFGHVLPELAVSYEKEEASTEVSARWGREEPTLKLASACKNQATSTAPWHRGGPTGPVKFFNTFERKFALTCQAE